MVVMRYSCTRAGECMRGPLTNRPTDGGSSNFYFAAGCCRKCDVRFFCFGMNFQKRTTVKTRFGILPAAIAVLVSSTMLAAGRSQDVKVLRSTEQSIQIEITPNYYEAKTVKFKDKEFVEYNFEGSLQLAKMQEAGVPDLKYKSLPLGFQSKEGNVVQVIVADYEDIPNVLLKPMPALHVKDGMLVVKEYAINNERYSQNQFLPGKVAELSSVEQSRSMLIGSVKVYPIQYNPAAKTLRRYSRIVVEVVFGSSSAARIKNDDDELFGGLLLNANEAKLWKFGKPLPPNRVTAGQPSVLANGPWYRLTVVDEGMYVLDANWFSANGISLSGIAPRTIKIFGNGGEELPEAVNAQRPVDLVQNAIYVEGEADGQFNSGDYVLFYGRGIQGIQYDPNAKTLRHYIHHYSRVNYYWLTFGGTNGKRMTTQQSVATAPTVIPNKFMDAVWVEPDTVNLIKSGKNWLSFPINPGGAQVRTFPLNGLIPNEPRTYRMTVVSGSSDTSRFNIRENGTLIGTYLFFYAASGATLASDATLELSGTFPVANNTSQLSFEFRSNDAGAAGWLDWAEIIYPRTFDPVNNSLRFRSPDTNGVVEYRLGQFSSAVSVFNVTRQDSVQRVSATSGTFRANEQGGRVSEYLAVAGSAYKVPAAVVSVQPQNLRGISQPYDFIILTSPEFATAANRLKEHRQTPAYGGLKTIVVDVNQIYNEFSCGVPDVSAIRDFLKYAYENWTPQTPPKFVCFFGQASYDYKGVLGSKTTYVPTWQKTEQPYDDIASASSDDFFVRFGPSVPNGSPIPSMVSGRLNARSTRQAEELVDRIIGYDTRSARDGWKTRALYVGDDAFEDGNIHTEQSEDIANLTPEVFEKRKVYLEEYPTVITTQGRRKPGAYQDIIDIINQGVLIVNFIGHGNPTVWTHESVFSTQTSIPQLFNANKLAYFFAATCNFSQFDDPTRETGSELLMNRVEGGAIGVVSASRKVYSNFNADLNRGIYRNMFRQDQFGRVLVDRVATAMFLFKVGGGSGYTANDEKYLVLGDPTLQLQFPRSYATIDSINGAPVEFVNGLPRTFPIQLRSLARVTLKGSIRNEASAVDSTARGQVTLGVNDATRSILIPTVNWSYSAVGSLIYRGENSVSNGKFAATFVVPKDIAYADSTTRGRVVAYYTSAGGSNDGAGFTNKVAVSGSNSAAPLDTAGPSMRISLGNSYENSLSFRPGDVVNEKPVLYVDLVDSNGINTSTSGIGHRIEAWFNGSAQSKDMTGFYTSKLDNFQAGTVQYPLRDLPQGRNTARVRAWDTYNNARTAETYFEVMSSEQLRVVDVMNYPNPFTKETSFTFRHNQAVPVNATVKIYTIAGRLIRTLDAYSAGGSFVAIPWDGRDRDGDELANGVYLYKLLVRTVDGRFNSEVLGKLAIAK